MKVIKSTKVVFCDVDETLLLFNSVDDYPKESLITITNPISGISTQAMPHHRHINLIQQMKVRGHTVVIWSQGGAEWAENVVKLLKIERLVDLVIDKPSWYIDDLHAHAFMENPIYLDPMNPLKDKRGWEIEDANK